MVLAAKEQIQLSWLQVSTWLKLKFENKVQPPGIREMKNKLTSKFLCKLCG